MRRIYTESDVRFCMSVVQYFGQKFGAENCFYELFDAGWQIGVCVKFPEMEKRHAVRVHVGDEKDLSAKLNEMYSWKIVQNQAVPS